MRRLLSLFACLIAVGASAVAGVNANAADDDVDAAYCPAGSITGVGTWTPPITTVMMAHALTWTTHAQCTGSGDENGAYDIGFNGTSNEDCATGTGQGTLTGTGPEGGISGTFTFRRIGVHLYISGMFLSGGEEHTLQYWLDVIMPTSEGVCVYSSAPLIGHGVIADWPLAG